MTEPELLETWHGKISGYNKRGCRCDLCKEAARRQNAKRKDRPKRPPPAPVTPDSHAGPVWRCPYCSYWKVRNGGASPNCPYCSNGRPAEMSAQMRTPPPATPARGTWAEDL